MFDGSVIDVYDKNQVLVAFLVSIVPPLVIVLGGVWLFDREE